MSPEMFSWSCAPSVTARAPIQTYANNHMITELAEPRIDTNVPRPFPQVRGGVLEQD